MLEDVSFDVVTGETVGLVGVNGAGKTTLIRGLLDLNRIDGGTISIFDRAHTETRARDPMSYLAERFAPPYLRPARSCSPTWQRYTMSPTSPRQPSAKRAPSTSRRKRWPYRRGSTPKAWRRSSG